MGISKRGSRNKEGSKSLPSPLLLNRLFLALLRCNSNETLQTDFLLLFSMLPAMSIMDSVVSDIADRLLREANSLAQMLVRLRDTFNALRRSYTHSIRL